MGNSRKLGATLASYPSSVGHMVVRPALACIHQVVRGHPIGQPLELLGELPSPDAMLVKLFVE